MDREMKIFFVFVLWFSLMIVTFIVLNWQREFQAHDEVRGAVIASIINATAWVFIILSLKGIFQ